MDHEKGLACTSISRRTRFGRGMAFLAHRPCADSMEFGSYADLFPVCSAHRFFHTHNMLPSVNRFRHTERKDPWKGSYHGTFRGRHASDGQVGRSTTHIVPMLESSAASLETRPASDRH
jgi:hypothetical protein